MEVLLTICLLIIIAAASPAFAQEKSTAKVGLTSRSFIDDKRTD